MSVARSYSGGVAIRYVLPVLWMASCLYVMAMNRRRSVDLSPYTRTDPPMGKHRTVGGVRYLRLRCLFVCDCDLNGKRLELLPTNCVSPPGKHCIPLSLSTCLNSFLTVFHPDPCVLPIHISLPVHPVLLATFPLGSFCVCTFYLDSLPAHIRSIDTLSTFKLHLKFHLF